jgi:hypothetical protein
MHEVPNQGTALVSCPNKALEAEACACATLRVNGTGSRAVPWFEGAHWVRRCAPFLKVRILENPDDSFEGAHAFARCAPKLSIFEERCAEVAKRLNHWEFAGLVHKLRCSLP